MTDELNPFAGLKRKRLPGMHMVTACEGGMPLPDALAACFFMMLHDNVRHGCLIEKALKEQAEQVRQAASNSETPDGAALSHIFGLMESSSLALEEWSYLDDKEVFVFCIIADGAIEAVQRWIAEGSHKPLILPLGGEIVQRSRWASEHFGTPDSEKRRGAREYVKKLLAEVETTAP